MPKMYFLYAKLQPINMAIVLIPINLCILLKVKVILILIKKIYRCQKIILVVNN